MKPPSVSIVIAAYNAEATVAASLRSLQGQSRRPVEIVVVDDGSTDGTAAQVASVCPEATLIRQQNRGLSVARNVGWRAASGELVGFLDADDECDPERVARQVEVLADRPDAVCVLTGQKQIRGGRSEVRLREATGRVEAHSLEALLRLCRHGVGASMLVRRAALEDLGGFDEENPKRPAGEDELLARLTSAGAVLTLWQPLYWVHISPTSMRWQFTPESFAATHARWLDAWQRAAQARGLTRAARAGLLRRCVLRALVSRDTAYIDAGLRRLSDWGPLTLSERATAAVAKAGLTALHLVRRRPAPRGRHARG